MNKGADDLQVGEIIIGSNPVLKAHLVATNGEEVYFGGSVFPYNIITRIQQNLKSEYTLADLVKHKNYLESLNMSEYEAITVYTFSIVDPGLFGGKRSTNSYIRPLTDYAKWRNKSLYTGLGYNIEKILDPVNQDTKMIILMQY